MVEPIASTDTIGWLMLLEALELLVALLVEVLEELELLPFLTCGDSFSRSCRT